MLKIRILRWEIIQDYLDGPNVNMRVLLRESERWENQRSDDRRTGCSDTALQPRNAHSLSQLEKVGYRFSPMASRRRTAQLSHFGLYFLFFKKEII